MTDAGRRGWLVSWAGLAVGAILPGCGPPARLSAVPQGRTGEAVVLGVPNERFRLERGTAPFAEEFRQAGLRRRRALGLPEDTLLAEVDLLAVSGGGENGAFGAGLLCGWTEHGSRPSFDVVTGVSTGALTAPFAYLGPRYDARLREVYTRITVDDVAIRRSVLAALIDDALADSSPLLATISRYLDTSMVADLAEAYREGRLLLIGTTDLDAQLPVIWNIGAIAASGHPGGAPLIRRLLLASAAIPGAFPPVMIDVTLDGVPLQEMHVDGGAVNQAFLYPAGVTQRRRLALRQGRQVQPARAFLIRNAKFSTDWASVERRAVSIAGRAVSTMIAASGYNDAVRIFAQAERDDIDFNLAYIGADFTAPYSAPFEPAYMRALFEYAYERARLGYRWSKRPPGV